jgi:hypothetical protein
VIAEAPAQLRVVIHEANQVETVRIDDHLIHKGIDRRAAGIGPFGK